MNKKMLFVWFALLLIILCVCFFLFNRKLEPAVYDIEKTFKYSLTIKNPTNTLIESSEVWVYVPVKITSTQKFVSVNASHDYNLVNDDLGNQKLVFDLKNMAPYSSKIITVQVRVDMSLEPNSIVINNAARFLQSERYVEVDAKPLEDLAADLQKDSDVLTAEAIYTWTVDNLEYEGFVQQDRGALFALQSRSGDCTEYSYLITALTRAEGMPARSIAGFVYSESSRIVAKDFHNWSEVLLESKWHLVDAQKEVFMDKYSDYVAMRIISSDDKSGVVNSQKYFYAESPLVAKLN